VRVDGSRAVDALQPLCLHREHTVLMLQHAFNEQERLADHGHAVAIEQIGADDDVGDPGFVLEGEEDKPLGGAGPLARDDHAGDTHPASVARLREIRGTQHTAQRQIIATQ